SSQQSGRNQAVSDFRPSNPPPRTRATEFRDEPVPTTAAAPSYTPRAANDTYQPTSRAPAEDKPWNRPVQRPPTPADHKAEFRPDSATTVGTESIHPSRAVTASVPSRPARHSPKRDTAPSIPMPLRK